MHTRNCQVGNCKDKDKNGNCRIIGSNGLMVQCVGPWVEDKYFFFEGYLNASCEARRKFTKRGNAVFIDLFSGPGKCIIRKEKREIDSGGIRALNRDEAPFNEYFFFDINKANVEALKKTIGSRSNCSIQEGDSNILIDKLINDLLKQNYRYHFAFIDPFAPDALKFDTLKKLAQFKRMDMFIHFPIGAIRRNLPVWKKRRNTILDDFLGTDTWREKI